MDAIYFSSLLLTPGGNDSKSWVSNKIRGGSIQLVGFAIANESVDLIKTLSGRERPDRSDNMSFPSSHARRSSANATLANRNIESMGLTKPQAQAIKTSTLLLRVVSSWSRVEAHAHYPSDVLAGWAIGHFWTALCNDMFVDYGSREKSESLSFMFVPEKDSVVAMLHWHF